VIRIRPALAPTLAALSVLVLVSGCAAGYNAQSIQPYAPADGVIADSGPLRVLDAVVVSSDGSGRGVLSMTLVNRGDRDDILTSITSPSGRVDLTGSRALAAGRTVSFGAGTDPAATVEALARQPGQTIRLSLEFARNRPIVLRTLVVDPNGAYASVTPGPETPEETDTPTPSETASGSATGTATGTATDTASPSPSAS
jgi:hypothetical protein